MFKNVHYGKLDNKGRMTLPGEFRRVANNILRAHDEASLNISLSSVRPCLIGFIDNPADPDSSKNFITEDNAPLCMEINPDSTGRFVLAPIFRNALTSMTANPEHVITVGRKEYFEIWTEENWKNELLELFKKRGFDFELNPPDAEF
jgi:DNA-binding transcriptional regulator/RsmH inhibitor MraZ